MKERNKAGDMSRLYSLRNRLVAQLAEVDMAIQRERLGNFSTTKPVTLQTSELLNKLQQSSDHPPYEQLLQ